LYKSVHESISYFNRQSLLQNSTLSGVDLSQGGKKEEAGDHFRRDMGFDALLITPADAYYPKRNPDATLACCSTRAAP
jgi:hypothetical protein